MNSILKIYFTAFALILCGVMHAQNAMCPDITECMMSNGHVVNVSAENLPMCIDGGDNIQGNFSTGVCLQPGTELSCTAYVFTRGPKSNVTSIGGPIGQGNGCNGQIDELLFQYVDPATNELVCLDMLDPAGGSQINADVVYPPDIDENGDWVVTELVIWVCANSNSFPTICSACANDPSDCTGCETDDDITRPCDDGIDCTVDDFEILDNCGFICTPCSGTDMCMTMCDLDPPAITVTDNTCDPEMDGFYEIATDCGPDSVLEFSTDNGVTWSTIIPTYPTQFLARCTGETCEVISYEGLDPMEDAVEQVNMGTVTLGDATLSIVQTFNGTSVIDENVITASQTTGDVGISSGVSHQCNQNSCGLIANSMNSQYNFSQPVCNLTIDLWDLDRDDEMVLVASGPNGPVSYVVNTIGSGVNNSGNTFTSNNPNANYPSDGSPTLGMFSVTFNDCVTQITIDYYDASDAAGNGGSYTIVFQEGCTFSDCSSEEITVFTNPQDCPMCVEDLIAVILPVNPVCAGTQINFDGTGSTATNVEYQWDFENDGTIDITTTTPMASFTYPTAGMYTVSLTVVDPTGNCPPVVTSIEIEICDQIMVVCPTSPITVVQGDPIDPASLGEPQFTTNACNPNPQISFIDNTVNPTDCSFAQIITRTFTISDTCGDHECVQVINVEIGNPADINALPLNPEICLGDIVSLNASASSGDGLTYCWNVGIGTPGCDYTTAIATHTYTQAGTYTISLSITDQYGCTDVETIGNVTVYEGPEVAALVEFDPCTLTLSYDGSNSVDNAPPSNLIYTWDFGDGITSGMVSGTHIFDNCAAVGTISLTIVDPDVPFAACNSDQIIFNFEVDAEPPVLVCPDPIDINCGDPIPTYSDLAEFTAAGGMASDNCDVVEFNQVSLDTIPGNCPYIYQVNIVYEALDICGNAATCTHVIDILPELPSASFPQDTVLSCGDDISPAALGIPNPATNSCTRPVVVTMEEVIESGSCPGDATITRTWIITDDCGNVQTQEQIITIINDIEPVLEGPPDITIDCLDACDPSATGGIAVAVDFCMPIDGTVNTVTITYTDEYVGFDGTIYPDNIVGYIIRTFVGVDLCGNEGIYVQTISIMRSNSTVLTCNDQINISLGSNCDGVTPDFLLEAPEDTKYFISLEDDQFGFALGPNETFDSIDWSVYIESGETVQYTITDFCGNTCWGHILIESNIIPEFESQCTYVPGRILTEAGSIDGVDELSLNDMVSLNEDPERTTDYLGTITLTDGDCQDAFIVGTSNFRYNAALHNAPLDIQYVDLILYLVNTTDGSLLVFPFDTGTIPQTQLGDLIINPGSYDVFVAAANHNATGDYSIHIEVDSCLPTCEAICGASHPDEFITIEEILDSLDNQCFSTLIGDIKVESYQTGDMCEGILHVETYFGMFNLHGEMVKREIITQAYVELPIDLEEYDILAPNYVELECGDEVTPEFILEETGDYASAYPYYLDPNQIKIDTICLEEVIDHFEVPIDTVQEMVSINGVWVLADIVKKETRDSVRCLRRGPNPDIQFQEILLDSNTCNVLVDYTDIVIEACTGGLKIIREWSIIDWCDNSGQLNFSQTIEVKDLKAPVIEKWDDVVISVDPWSCAGVYKLPTLAHTDNCTGAILSESWQSSEGEIVDGYALDLWLSEEPIEIYLAVSDDCGNTALDTFNILVEDHIAPVAVCKDNLSVTLTSAMLQANAGEGKIYADIFDAGSHDSGCDNDISIQVRRVEGCCSSECVEQFECIETDPKTGICIDSTVVAYTTLFNDFVKFCCDDVGQIVMVELMITDKVGNSNACMVEVTVVDKTQSILICEPITVDCLQDSDQMDGPIVTGQYCDSHINIQLLNESEITGNCGLQQIIKEWYIDSNGDGEFSSGDPYCQQQITVEAEDKGLDPYSIKWPKHFTGEVHVGINLECNEEKLEELDDVQVNMGDVQLCGSSITDSDESGYAATGEPVWCGAACSLIAHSLEIDTIFSSDACYKIINRWTVIDWCKWEANGNNVNDGNDQSADEFVAVEDWAQGECHSCPDESDAIADPIYFRYTNVREDGYYTFDQIIKVIDDAAPVIEVDDSFLVQTTGGAQSKEDATSCTGDAQITATATDFCNGIETAAELVEWSVVITKGEYTIDIQTGKGSSMTVNTGSGSPGDIHTIAWTVSDGCGNVTNTTTEVSFDDQVKPTPFCIAGVTTNVAAGQDVLLIWAPDVDFGSYDNCTDFEDLNWAIVPEGSDPILPGNEGFDEQFSLPIDCDTIGSVLFVDMWVFDANGNGDYCTSSIIVDGSCDDSTEESEEEANTDEEDNENGEVEQGAFLIDIGGSVLTASGEAIENTFVNLSATAPEYPKSKTVINGKYGFIDNPSGYNYSVEAEKDINHINGVSTFDVLLLQRHILGLQILDSPYKIIAADINADQTVSGVDIVEARKLILGYTDSFEDNKSWRFTDANQDFISGDSPWPFSEQIDISALSMPRLTENFIGIKIGDLNDNVVANDLNQVEVRYQEQLDMTATISKVDPRILHVVASHSKAIQGLQFEIQSLSNSIVSFRSEDMRLTESNSRITDDGALFSWHSDTGINESEAVTFEILFDESLRIEDLRNLNLSTNRINPEVYVGKQLDILNLEIDLIHSADGVNSLSQNWPNPFNKVTQIEFYLDQDYAEVVLSIFNTNGQLVWEKKGSYDRGTHQELIQASDLGAAGIYQYAIKTKDYSQTKRLILAE